MIALYRGISLASRLIRLRTWSDYSHASWISEDFKLEIESWGRGVQANGVPFSLHTPHTAVDLFDVPILTAGECEGLQHFLLRQVGRSYDWPGILGFVTRRDQGAESQRKWFCSELLAAAFESIRRPLLCRIKPWRVYPGLLAYSPMLSFLRRANVPDYAAERARSNALQGICLDPSKPTGTILGGSTRPAVPAPTKGAVL
jgi:hypothetical protein